ncbi:alpha/beta fold hydrolase [Nocardia jiangxiensis]|uniref:Alpha/beta fold hydrolase n=1 Tax=Nocardia jiangxiensis TaxID=282685 RepID=A0ABW6S8W0_9NOCA
MLLIPGTGGTPAEVWSWNYARALPSAGYGVCTVALPDRALGSFATSAEYAAYAALYAHRVSGRPIAVLGHSQGGVMAFRIAKFWPQVADVASDVIGLAAPLGGTALAG